MLAVLGWGILIGMLISDRDRRRPTEAHKVGAHLLDQAKWVANTRRFTGDDCTIVKRAIITLPGERPLFVEVRTDEAE